MPITLPRSLRPKRAWLTWQNVLLAFVLVYLFAVLATVRSSAPPPSPLPVLNRLSPPAKSPLWPLAFSPDGSKLLTGSLLGESVQLWDVKTGKSLFDADLKSRPMSATFAPDGRTVVVFSLIFGPRSPKKIHVLNAADGTTLALRGVLADILVRPRFSLDGSHFEVTTRDLSQAQQPAMPSVDHVWNTSDWNEGPPHTLALAQHSIMGFAPDGTRAVTDDRMMPGLTLWDMTNDPPTSSPLGSPSTATSMLKFSPDGQTLAQRTIDDTLTLWDMTTRTPTAVLTAVAPGDRPWSVEFVPDGVGRTLVTLDLGPVEKPSMVSWLFQAARYHISGKPSAPRTKVVIRDRVTGATRVVLHHEWQPTVSPDGKVLATGSADGTLTLWSLER